MDFDTLRKNMVEQQLIARGDITDKNVLEAFLKVPRHKFVPSSEQNNAYADCPLPIGYGQTISQPYMVALMTQWLKLKGNEKVLEIGTGCGYQTAILAEIANEVYTIERLVGLSENAKRNLSDLSYDNIYFRVGDGTLGWKENAPFGAILVTAGAPKAPATLLEQLADGARLVIPIGRGLSQTLTIFEKVPDTIQTAISGKVSGTFSETKVCGCMFVPLVGKEGWEA